MDKTIVYLKTMFEHYRRCNRTSQCTVIAMLKHVKSS